MQEEYVAKLKDFPFIEDVSKLKTVVDNVELKLWSEDAVIVALNGSLQATVSLILDGYDI
jgi:hypothetical protein